LPDLGPDLHTSYVGLELRNPLIVSPAGITETVKRMKKAEEAGCGAVVVKTLFEEAVTRRSPTPRFRILRKRGGCPESFVLYSYEQASPFGPGRYAREIRNAKKALRIPVIASVGCTTEEGWRRYSRLMESSGADALELNVSCPHGSSMLADSDVSDTMCRATRLAKEAVSVPVIPKMTPQTASPLGTALTLEASRADAVVMFNRFTGLDIELEKEAPTMHGGFAGHGGPWSLYYLLRWLVATSPRLGIPISASGGIWTGHDMAKAILAGATTTQMCSAVVIQGYDAITAALNDVRAFMEMKGYSSPKQFRGKACGRVLSAEQVDRRKTVIAWIDPGRCTSCGICQKVCIYQAVLKGEKAFLARRSCQGCGLCVEVCPEEAISMSPRQGAFASKRKRR